MQRVMRRALSILQAPSTCQHRTLLVESFARGPSEPPLLEQTVGEHFSSIVSKFGDHTAVISRHQQTRLTYDALDRKSNALARGLTSAGVKKGDRVAISLGNNIENAIATYGIFKLGAILVPLNPAFSVQQVIAALVNVEASHLIIGAETCLSRKPPKSNISTLREILKDPLASKVESSAIPSLKQIIVVNNSKRQKNEHDLRPTINFDHILQDGGSETSLAKQRLHPNDIVNIQFTSGTTAAPKAACLTHRSILNNGNAIGDRMILTERDIVCCPPPLFHCFGSILGYMATATHGSAIVFPSEAFDPEASLKSVQEERCTALYGVPTMFIAELELLASGAIPCAGFEHLRTGIVAGSGVPSELMRKLHKTLNLTQLTICYGMTETSPVSAMTTTDDPMEKRIDSVGKLLSHVEAKIVNPSDRKMILPIGARGELAISGYLLMKGYWDAPKKSAEVMIPDDTGKVWMHVGGPEHSIPTVIKRLTFHLMKTGDEAQMDADGYIKITGRIKDLIIRGGENIHPLEIENCLLACPTVADVSVVGIPDVRYGEVVVAFVIPNAGKEVVADEIKNWVKERLSHHLVSKHVFPTTEFPKTTSGKVQKFKLRELGKQIVADQGLQ